MSIYEYDEEKHMCQTRQEGYEDGYGNGYDSGFDEGILGSLKICKRLFVSREDAMKEIMEVYSLSVEKAEEMMRKYWPSDKE